jgi:hypothetical protein
MYEAGPHRVDTGDQRWESRGSVLVKWSPLQP